ncbi:phosphatase PAP2 family protein [Mycobacterium sp.]|uniref:phosphatase PAP2 family protein n=1 Tax=Mycobacterium sp. TaxID=1785 RepID=UPI003F96BA30
MGPISAVSTGILVAVIVTAVWLTLNQHRLQTATARMRDAVQRLLTRHLGHLGQHGIRWATRLFGGKALAVLTIGLITLCGLSALLAYVSDSVREYDGIAVVDRPIVAWFAAHREPVLTTLMRTLSTVGSPVSAVAVAVTVCAAAAWRSRSWLPVATVAIGLAGFALAVTVVKLEVARQRPPLPYAVMAVDGYSFPSGHALGVTIAALISAWVLDHWLIRSWNGRIAVWTTAIVIIGGVGFSRVYLGVHYPSDVIAGWLLGAIWAGALLTCAGMWSHVRRDQHRTTPAVHGA